MCFSPESLSLWNRAIAGADSNRAEPTREAAAIDTATSKQILSNASDNFETCNSNSVKHNALIDKIDTLKGKMSGFAHIAIAGKMVNKKINWRIHTSCL